MNRLSNKSLIVILLTILLVQSCKSVKSNNKITFIMIGDSITYGIRITRGENRKLMNWQNELGKRFKNARFINTGFPGWETVDILENIEYISSYKTKKTYAFIMIGINDYLQRERNINDVFRNIKKICEYLITNNIKPIIQSILPVVEFNSLVNINEKVIKTNKLLYKYSKSKKIYFIDTHSLFSINNGRINNSFFYDGLHLNLSGYRRWINDGIFPFLTLLKNKINSHN